MIEPNYLKLLESQETINQNIKGGFEGLEILFNKHISKLKSNNFILSHSDFNNFYHGTSIEILGINNYPSEKNNEKIKSREFEDFFETHYQFYNNPTPFDVFNDPCNILQESLNEIKKIIINSTFGENEKITLLKEFLKYIENEVAKSNDCKEIENPKLYPKLIYLKEGYVKIYNEVLNVYSHYLDGFEKQSFVNKEIEKPLKKEKEIKNISDFIYNVKDKDAFLNILKTTFKKEKGKKIRAIIDLLKRENILIIPERDFLDFYNCLKTYLDRNIGTYQSINDVKDIQSYYFTPFEEILNPIIKNHKITKPL